MTAIYTGIANWDTGAPRGTEKLSQADDHLRGIKTAISNDFPNINGVVQASHDEINALLGYTTGGDTIETRLALLEALLTGVTNTQLLTLAGIDELTTIQAQLDAITTWRGSVSTEELHGLADYILSNGTVETRLNALAAAIAAIDGGGDSSDLSELTARVVSLEACCAARRAACSDVALASLAPYYGGVYASTEYSGEDLGADFLLVTQKLQTLENNIGTGGDGTVAWQNVLPSVSNPESGKVLINNELNRAENEYNNTQQFGYLAQGCLPFSIIDFRFTDGVPNGQESNWASEVNPNKVMHVSASGNALVSILLAGTDDGFGYGGLGRLPETGEGTVQVKVTERNTETEIIRSLHCQYFVIPV